MLISLQMMESASKGAILVFAKEEILAVLNKAEVSPGNVPAFWSTSETA